MWRQTFLWVFITPNLQSMAFDSTSSSWFGRILPAATSTSTSSNGSYGYMCRHFIFFSSSSKPANTISSCSTGPSNSTSSSPSTRSYSRRWYNPLRHKPFDEASPEILRHWIDADPHPIASQGNLFSFFFF